MITHRLFIHFFHREAIAQTIGWLEKHAIPYSDLCFMEQKASVGADIYRNNIEDVMGRGKFVIFYLTCGILAALSHTLTDPGSTVPMVGASGAISGILGAYLLLFPRARVLVLLPLGYFTRLLYVPAGFVLGFWFLLQLLLSGSASLGRGGGGVAWFAHVGGFVAGMGLIGLFKRRDVRFFAPRRHH